MDFDVRAIRERITLLKKEFRWTENSLAKDPATQKRLNRQLSHDTTITLDTLLLILEACPGVSADWLLLGRGNMLSVETGTQNSPAATVHSGQPDKDVIDADIVYQFVSLLEEKDRQMNTMLTLLSRNEGRL